MARWADELFIRLTGAEPDISKQISDEAARNQPVNSLLYFAANALGKLADELSSARLVLPWLFGVLAVPTGLVGFLVPLREAGVLLPQTWIAAYGQRFSRRKGLWITGALISALSLVMIAVAAQISNGWIAGALLLVLLSLYSLGRGICSVTAKEVVGKVVAKSVRGKLMGWSSSVSGLLVVGLGIWLSVPQPQPGLVLITVLLSCAALIWVFATLLFAQIREPEQSLDLQSTIGMQMAELWQTVLNDRQLRRFIWVRALLISTALVHPYIVLLIQQQQGASLELLGYLLLISAIVSALAAPLWGRLSDLDSPLQMMIAALFSAIVSLGVGVALVGGMSLGFLHLAGAYACLTVAHTGVRLGRKVYLLDLSDSKNRGAYTALSNTAIGLVMLMVGVLGLISQGIGIAYTLVLLGSVALFAAWQARKLPAVTAE